MFTFLIVSDATGEQLSALRFETLQGAAQAAASYMVTAAENGDYVLTQLIDVSRHVQR